MVAGGTLDEIVDFGRACGRYACFACAFRNPDGYRDRIYFELAHYGDNQPAPDDVGQSFTAQFVIDTLRGVTIGNDIENGIESGTLSATVDIGSGHFSFTPTTSWAQNCDCGGSVKWLEYGGDTPIQINSGHTLYNALYLSLSSTDYPAPWDQPLNALPSDLIDNSFQFITGFADRSGDDLPSTVTDQFFGSMDTLKIEVTEAVPEPSSWAMMILGFAGVGFMAYRRRVGLTVSRSLRPDRASPLTKLIQHPAERRMLPVLDLDPIG